MFLKILGQALERDEGGIKAGAARQGSSPGFDILGWVGYADEIKKISTRQADVFSLTGRPLPACWPRAATCWASGSPFSTLTTTAGST
jgi:hypothetical protein